MSTYHDTDKQGDAVTVTHHEEGNKGRYVAHVEGQEAEGEMTYSRASASLIVLDHTGVDDRLRGRGIGAILANAVVEDARAKGQRIMPLCPFFKAQVERHPEWQDVIKA